MSAGTIIDTRETGATPTALETCDDAQARDFAARWVAERAIASFDLEATPEQSALVHERGVLTRIEVAQLLAWVKVRMAATYPHLAAGYSWRRFPGWATEHDCLTDDVAEKLAIAGDIFAVRALCKAAGWPS